MTGRQLMYVGLQPVETNHFPWQRWRSNNTRVVAHCSAWKDFFVFSGIGAISTAISHHSRASGSGDRCVPMSKGVHRPLSHVLISLKCACQGDDGGTSELALDMTARSQPRFFRFPQGSASGFQAVFWEHALFPSPDYLS